MKTITFYSYKGGVGRSLTLANMAARLAEFGKKVCLIDFDLEAPGLHLKFKNELDKPIKSGIVDYIHSYATGGILPDEITPYGVSLSLHSGGDAFLIPAGNIDNNNYWKNLSSIDWYNLVYENPNSISFFLDLKKKIKKELAPDFLLIDSRTGISEMSGITISLLADEVVIVSANNAENLSGSKRIIDHIVNNNTPLLDKKPPVSFVLSRIPYPNVPADRGKEQRLIVNVKNELANIDDNSFFILHSDRELEIEETRKIGHDLENKEKTEEAIQITKEYLLLFEHLTNDVLTPDEKIKFDNVKKSKKLLREAYLSPNLSRKIDLLKKTVALDPTNVNAWVELANSTIEDGDIIEGINLFKTVSEQKSNLSAFFYENWANAFIKNKQFDKAETIFHKIIELFPEEKNVGYHGLGRIKCYSDQYDKAIEYFTKGIAEIEDEYGYNSRADAHLRLKQYDAALSDIYVALELNPDAAVSYATLAEINLAQKKMNEFYLNFEIALSKSADIIAKNLPEEGIYASVLNEQRFKNLLEKYNVPLPSYEQ